MIPSLPAHVQPGEMIKLLLSAHSFSLDSYLLCEIKENGVATYDHKEFTLVLFEPREQRKTSITLYLSVTTGEIYPKIILYSDEEQKEKNTDNTVEE